MFYLIYKITNNINKKIYIGSHKTKNKDDGYMGSGKYLNYAINKYGVENFTKEILFIFDNAKEMYDKEAEIVDDTFLAEENTYNLKRGGFGGFDYINDRSLQNKRPFTVADSFKGAAISAARTKETISACNKLMWSKVDTETRKQHTIPARTLANTDAAILTKKATWKKNNKGVGSKNSQYGSMWITDGLINKKINKDSIIPDGWCKGRKF